MWKPAITPALLLVLASLGCGRSFSQGPTGPSSVVLTRPLTVGQVRVANEGPLAGAIVTLRDASSSQVLRSVRTDAFGMFEIPVTTTGCHGFAQLDVFAQGFMANPVFAPYCIPDPNPPVVTLNLSVARSLVVNRGEWIQFSLSNEDLDFLNDAAYTCGPCAYVSLPNPPLDGYDIEIDVPSAGLSAWLTAANRDYDDVKLGEFPMRSEGTHRLRVPSNPNGYFYFAVKIGLPGGARASGGLAGTHAIGIRVH